jgi:hypothetical protein
MNDFELYCVTTTTNKKKFVFLIRNIFLKMTRKIKIKQKQFIYYNKKLIIADKNNYNIKYSF